MAKRFVCLAIFLLLAIQVVHAQSSRFDLIGPPIDVRVTRAGISLPIASVPNLQAGDKLWLHPDLPPTQSVHYLLVAVFLRGTTNPPPDSWFIKIETWNKSVREEGQTVTVPDEAQQVILFLAPATGGDFSTLRSAVQGRPGIFVRADQDLNEAGFEQARVDKYIASMRLVPPGDPKALLEHSDLLARTLNLKPDDACFKRPIDQQYNCLTQTGNQTLLDDGHGQTIVSSLTSGPNSDFISAASATQLAGSGLYSAYVGAIVDLVRIMSGLHTAQYQYIPAISSPQQQSLNLRLNTPPSFHNPKSVIVIGLPAIQAESPPPLRPADPTKVACLLKPNVALGVEGAPLVFSTSFAHNLVLHLNPPNSGPDIPLVPDAYQGGLVIAPAIKRHPLPTDPSTPPDPATPPASTAPAVPAISAIPAAPPVPSAPAGELTGTISGLWGFDPFTGPTVRLQDSPGKDWRLTPGDSLIAGRDNHVHLASTGTACVQSITAEIAPGKSIKADWKHVADSPQLEVSLALHGATPTNLHLSIRQFGQSNIDTVSAQAFSEPAKLEAFLFHAGDSNAVLRGDNLDQVKQVEVDGVLFLPSPAVDGAPSDNALPLSLAFDAKSSNLRPGKKIIAMVSLNDGRVLRLPATVNPPRPSIALLDRRIEQPSGSTVQLAGKDDLPLDQPLTFSLKSTDPFSRKEEVEIASPDGTLATTLSIASGSLVLEDPHTVLVTFDPLKAFGPSAFGPLRLRAVAPTGTGDWLPLVTLVRLPTLSALQCPTDPTQLCTLTGSNLYLIDAIAADPDFANPTTVPEGFTGTSISIPHPSGALFYLRLRDDPSASNPVTLPIQPQ